MLADADKLDTGPVKVLGNWSPGQIFKHLAIVYMDQAPSGPNSSSSAERNTPRRIARSRTVNRRRM